MSKRINTIIVDDNRRAADKLREDLSAFAGIEVTGCIHSPETAIEELVKQQPALLFLDIEMPGMSGLELLSEIQHKISNMKVVFYTAYNQYLIDAIRSSAFDYLQKPYLPEELAFIIERLRTEKRKKEENLSQSLEEFRKRENRFAIQTVTGLMFVKCDEVLLFLHIKEQRCWLMKLVNGKQYKLRSNVKARELTELHASFIQINQQCIININYLISIENKNLKCIMSPPYSDIDQTVSSRFYKRLREELDIL